MAGTTRWEGEIASAGETGTPSNTVTGRLRSTHTRSNNTIIITNINVGHNMNPNGAYWDYEWQADAWINSHTEFSNRQTKGRTGLTAIGTNWYYTSVGSYNLSVGTGSGTYALKGNWKCNAYGDISGTQSVNVSYPAAGAPAGTTGAPYDITRTSIKIRNNVTSWGSYCTAGSVRSYRATNSGFSGQTYIGTTDNAEVNHTGLTPNDEYWFRGWQNNGAGLSAYQGSTRTAVTLPNAPVAGTPVPLATTCTIPNTLDLGGNKYTITRKYRIKETGGSYGSWITYTGDIELTGLTPVQEYEVQTRSTTTAGDTDGGTVLFTTLPAGKLVYSGGSVANAIPRIVETGETTVMANINIIDPA